MRPFQDYLKEYRADNNLSQTQLAKVLGTTQQMISLYEVVGAEPSLSRAIELLEILGVKVGIVSTRSPGQRR